MAPVSSAHTGAGAARRLKGQDADRLVHLRMRIVVTLQTTCSSVRLRSRAHSVSARIGKREAHMRRLGIFLLLALTGSVFDAARADRMEIPPRERTLLPSRPQGNGCEWKPFEAPALGIRMLVQNCAKPDWRYVFSVSGNAIFVKSGAAKGAEKNEKIVESFTKPAEQSLGDAIAETFVQNLTGTAKASCQVRVVKDSLVVLSEQVIVDIAPTGAYGVQIADEARAGRQDLGCGAYGANKDGTQYFVYHPDEDKTRYLFIAQPENKSLFDQDSILLYPLGSNEEAARAPVIENKMRDPK